MLNIEVNQSAEGVERYGFLVELFDRFEDSTNYQSQFENRFSAIFLRHCDPRHDVDRPILLNDFLDLSVSELCAPREPLPKLQPP
jgi:hypothetical protein